MEHTCSHPLARLLDLGIALSLPSFGMPVLWSVAFGNNETVVKNSAVLFAKLLKRHTCLSHHRVNKHMALVAKSE